MRDVGVRIKAHQRRAFSLNLYGKLARYYDAVHRTRDYVGETRFLDVVCTADGTRASRRALELFCGTGGHTIPLADRGWELVGIDASPEMLAIADGKVHGETASIDLRQADCRALGFQRQFDLAFALGQSMHYMLTHQDLHATLREARAALRPGGHLIFDVINPWRLLEPHDVEHYDVAEDGTRILRMVRTSLDQRSRVRRADMNWLIEGGGGQQMVERTCEASRIWFVNELEHALEMSGFDRVAIYGDFERDQSLSGDCIAVVFVASIDES